MRIGEKVNVPFKTQQFVIPTAQAGNFHRAARLLGVDPSVVVRSVERLETGLGTRLFVRSRSHFTVTEAGKLFVREIQNAISHVERAWDLARYQSRIELGPFRIGYSAYVHSRLIPILQSLNLPAPESSVGRPAASTQLEAAPPGFEMDVVLQSGTTIQLIDRVQRGELHAGLGVQPLPAEEDLFAETITREAFCLCVPKNHRLARQPVVLAKEIDGEMVFFLPRSAHPGLYDRTMEYIESTGARPLVREVLSFTHTMEIVSHNFGLALLPRSASHLSHMGVAFKPVADKLLWMETALFLRRDAGSERVRRLRDELLSRFRSAPLDH